MKVTDEMADKHWEALRERAVLNIHAPHDLARNALAETLADVPEPGPFGDGGMSDHLLQKAHARIAELEAQLAEERRRFSLSMVQHEAADKRAEAAEARLAKVREWRAPFGLPREGTDELDAILGEP